MAKGNHDDLLLYGALAVAVFVGGKAVLNKLGLDPADANTISAQSTMDPTDNPFNADYQPFIDDFADNNTGVPMADYFVNVKGNYDAVVNQGGTAAPGIATWAEDIYKALGFWHFVVDSAAVKNAFSQMTTKVEVAYVAAYFRYNFGKDLLSYLKNGATFSNGLLGSDLATIITYVNDLPESS